MTDITLMKFVHLMECISLPFIRHSEHQAEVASQYANHIRGSSILVSTYFDRLTSYIK